MASIKDLKRICDFYPHCNGCPIKPIINPCSVYRFPDGINEIVDNWVAEHPVKTYAMDFFEKFPNAPRLKGGTPKICIERIYNVARIDEYCCEPKCIDCWNQEMKEDD